MFKPSWLNRKSESALFAIGLIALAPPAFSGSITITSIGLQINGDSSVAGINAAGQVAGTTKGGTGFSAVGNVFLYYGGTTINLGQLGGRDAYATGLNNLGHIVGSADLMFSGTTSFLYSNGSAKYLPAGFNAFAINDLGVIAGAIQPDEGLFTAALYWNGKVTNLGTPGPTFNSSQATAINNKGEVVGYGIDSTNQVDTAFFYSNGVMTNLGSLAGATNSIATAINREGVVVGPADAKGFVYYKGKSFFLPTPSNVLACSPSGINNRNQIVGSYTPQGHVFPDTSAFLYSNGRFIDLNQLLPTGSPWELASAMGINDAGQIVGIGYLNGNHGPGATQVYLMDLSGLK